MKKIIAIVIILNAVRLNLSAQCPPPAPTQGSGYSGCAGSTIVMNAVTPPTVATGTHRWYTAATGGSPISGVSNVVTGGGSNPIVSTYSSTFPQSTTFYIATYYATGNCESARTPLPVTIITIPALNLVTSQDPSDVGPDENFTMTVPPSTAYTAYQWYSKNGATSTAIGGATGNQYFPAASGTYWVKVTTSCNVLSSSGVTLSIVAKPDMNYVKNNIVRVEGIVAENSIASLPVASVQSATTYMDGLGRTLQQVLKQGSPGKQDMVQPVEYDSYGREAKKYLPYAKGIHGYYHPGATTTEQADFYTNAVKTAHDAAPYAQTIFDASPLNRVIEQGAPGAVWQPAGSAGKTTKMDYQLNTTTDGIRLWVYNYATGLCSTPGIYAAGTLYKTQVTDEHGYLQMGYQDPSSGLTVYTTLQDNATSYLESYHIYNDFDKLCILIPPMGVKTLQNAGNWTVTQAFLDTWCFQYQYDERQRMIAQKAPGAAWVYMVYDNRDRLVMTQDGNQRLNNQWLYTKYDVLNRPVITGIYTVTGSVSAIRTAVYAQTAYNEIRTATGMGYSLNRAYPVNPDPNQLLTVTFYDDYSFKGEGHWPNPAGKYDFVPELGFAAASVLTESKMTGQKVKVLNDNTWLKNVSYYDDKYRVIQSTADNYTATGAGGIDRITNLYDFIGQVLQSKLTHTGIQNVTVLGETTYDHAGRVLNTYHTINSGARVLLSQNIYNELGQLIDKKLHSVPGTNFLQSVDYRYTIRGWLGSINNSALTADGGLTNDDSNDLWGMELRYTTTTLGIGKPQYNGNIAEILWNRRDFIDNTTIQNPWGTAYGYDPLNRLKSVQSARKTSVWAADTKYDENFSYDKNGNITALTRNGMVAGIVTPIDLLTYTTYNGNQVTKIEDAASGSFGFVNGANTTIEYTYDANGNMKTDLNKSLGVTYNYINLPQVVTVSGNIINYVYDAGGRLLKKTSGTGIVYYCGGVQFEQDGTGAEQLYYAGTAEGRVIKKSGVWGTYEYFMTDHLGNTAISFDQGTNGNAEIIQVNAYYSFGLGLVDGTMAYMKGDKNRRLFNKGSELQDDFGLNMYFTKYRTLALDAPRWLQIDPLADQGKLVNWTPYNVFYNNPLRYNDPNGDCPGCPSPDANPLAYIAEGFRQYFDAALSLVSYEGKFFKKSSDNGGSETKIGDATVSEKTEIEVSAYAKADFSGVMNNNGNNEFAPGKVFDAGIKSSVAIISESKVSAKVGNLPVSVAASNTLNVTDKTSANKVEVSIGVNQNNVQAKAFVSGTSTTNADGSKQNKAAAGVKVQVPVYDNGKQTINLGFQFEVVKNK